jgi:hypothetical protein
VFPHARVRAKETVRSMNQPNDSGERVNYIGVSIHEFIGYAQSQLATDFGEGTKIDPAVRSSYAHFVESLHKARLSIDYYVFVFSHYIFIKIIVKF